MSGKKTFLITGAGSGFGREVAFMLAERGHDVVATVEIVSQIQALRELAKKRRLSLRIEKLDITDEDDRQRAGTWDIDVLVNNAGISEGGSLVDLPERFLRRQFEVNVFGTALLTQKIARNFIKRKSGRIVFVSSVAGLTTDPFAGAYSASKHALEAFAESLNKELREFGVQVATVNPGPILTGFNDRMFEAPRGWRPEERRNAVFDYTNISFPHQQYDSRQVSERIVEVATGANDSYRNVVPEDIVQEAREQMDAVWSRKVNTTAKRDELVQRAYEIAPETHNGK